MKQLGILGPLEPCGGRYGFRAIAAARQIAAITRSPHEFRKWLPEAHLSNLRLTAESFERLLVEQRQGQLDKSGQFQLPVLHSEVDIDTLFEEAQAAEDAQDMATAEQLYRCIIKMDRANPVAPFKLAKVSIPPQARPIPCSACRCSVHRSTTWWTR